MLRRRSALIAATTLTAALALTSCNANSRGSATNSGSASGGGGATAAPRQGGALYEYTASKEIHFDPAKSQNLGTSTIHLILRGLTTWKTSPTGTTELAPDLATSTGTASDGGKTWTFKLKSGLKYADGSPITAQDVKFGVERSFDPQLQGGLSYHKALLVGGDSYQGPAKGKHLDSIQAPDATTIVFHLNKAFADFPWVASMPAFAPVPAGKGMGIPAYDHTPPASGPYQVASYTVGSKVTLKRNPNWQKATDPVRLGAPDTITYEMGLDPDTLAQRMVDDQGNDKNGAGVQVTSAIVPKINADPAVKARTTVSPSGAAEYLFLNTSRPGLTDLNVRKALEYAINKQSLQTIAGGPTYGGAISTTLIPPGVQGYQKYDLYPAPATGDVTKAKQLLGSTKLPTLNLVYDSTSPGQAQQAASIQADLKKLGVNVKLTGQDSDTWQATVSQSNNFDLTISGWQADYPGAYAQLQPVFAANQIGNGNFNLSKFKDPAVDKAIDDATALTDPDEAAKAWAKIDQQILQQAPVVPLYYSHQAYLNGSNVTNTYIPTFPTYPNVLIQGLRK
ncbi:ABC transporter substrate-binding protein [Flexivirga sp. ID2601S]|uniref:ABC transporter substrate-binding protein n=1 Tax=Flexivirga aerilata TaxID=1656889 RepID=A0A849AEX2_9MICO|nr:ABC transporter substrate-binding protein [Flexivirga aerilata]NNG38979.1 ABC transporter substrate-binding protein [Flexivirga aerilata]